MCYFRNEEVSNFICKKTFDFVLITRLFNQMTTNFKVKEFIIAINNIIKVRTSFAFPAINNCLIKPISK